MRVGIVGDLHEPFSHPMYQSFCLDVFAQWDVEHIHFIGDMADNHAISKHKKESEAHGASREADLAEAALATWYELVPKATVTIGNHDVRHYSAAHENGLPDRFVRTYVEVWNTPGWDWDQKHVFDDVVYQHGNRKSGVAPAFLDCMKKRDSVVQGHNHTAAGVKWHASEKDVIFGMDVGCGLDADSYAAAYGKENSTRPILACGVVIDGHPYCELMPCGPKDPYHKSKARKR